MKIQELLAEQTISSVPSGTGGTVPTVQPTMGPANQDADNKTNQNPNQPNPELVAQLRSRLNDLKSTMTSGSGQDFDSNILAQTLAGQASGGTNTAGINSAGMKSLKASVLPSIINALQNPQTTNSLKTALNTANQASLKQQQKQQIGQQQSSTQPVKI